MVFSLISSILPGNKNKLFNLFKVSAYKRATIAGEYDLVILGGGIVGVATGRELIKRHPELKFAILEKEKEFGLHQTGRNSGVIHAGIYYKPGSMKAKLCVEGNKLMYEYCDKFKIPYKKIGKLVVAIKESEIPYLEEIFERAKKNKCPNIKLIDSDEIKKIEPNCTTGLKAIWSPETGIVDYRNVTKSLLQNFYNNGGCYHLNFKAESIDIDENSEYPIKIVNSLNGAIVKTKYLITACGLHSDTISDLTKNKKNLLSKVGESEVKEEKNKNMRIVAFRGEYLVTKQKNLVSTNIYPVPDPNLPFLGVHFTPRINGDEIWLGPNAVFCFDKEGYKTFKFSLYYLYKTFFFSGFHKFTQKYFTAGLIEFKNSVFTSSQIKNLKQYIPALDRKQVFKCEKSGVRAQALDDEGNLIDDFVFDHCKGTPYEGKVIHVTNAPSPGATSSLTIANMISAEAEESFFKNS